jgi:5-(carboxyamino)imidazole ribonucleotide mutase
VILLAVVIGGNCLAQSHEEAKTQNTIISTHFVSCQTRDFFAQFSTPMKNSSAKPLVGILMGSDSDWPTMKAAADALAEFGIASEAKVISAHRDPHGLEDYASTARKRGLCVIIAGAGGAAHLPGVTAAFTTLPVIGVPIESKSLKGLDSLLSIVQMPAGVPVATVGIGAGRNAGLLAVQILAAADAKLQAALAKFKDKLADESRAKNKNLSA